jgi:hypothetical protein
MQGKDRGDEGECCALQITPSTSLVSSYLILQAMEYVTVMKAMGISTGPGSKVLQTFVQSGGKGSGWLTRDVTKKQVTSHGETLEKVLVAGTRCCRQRGGQCQKTCVCCIPLSSSATSLRMADSSQRKHAQPTRPCRTRSNGLT